MSDQLRGRSLRIVGSLLLLAGLAINPWVLRFLAGTSRVPHSMFGGALLAAGAIVLVTAGVYLLTRNVGRMRTELGNFALLAASLVFCFLLLEVFIRWTAPASVFYPNLSFYPHRNLTIHVKLHGVSPVVHFTTNKWGMRGDPVPDDWNEHRTILTVGGSTTQCFYLSDDKTWPARLQALLRGAYPDVMVQNAGLDGHSTRGHLLMMRKVVPVVKPDLVIFLLGLNDLSLSISEKERLFGARREMTGTLYWIFSHSRVVQVLFRWYQVVVNKAPVVQTQRFYLPNGFPTGGLRHPTPMPASLESVLPSLPAFRDNIDEIITLAKRQHVKVLFLTQPLLFEDTPRWRETALAVYWLKRQKYSISAATFRRMLDIFNNSLLEICDRRQVSCFDLASAVPHDRKYFYDVAHLNEVGAERVARAVSAYLVKTDLLASEKGDVGAGRPTRMTGSDAAPSERSAPAR